MSERRFVSELSLIRQAVARGWCHPKNKHKEMDVDLAEAISYEVLNQLYDLHGEKEQPISRQEALRISRETLDKAEKERLPDPWEAWVLNMPGWMGDSYARDWHRRMQDWFREMPRGKG